MLRGRGVWGVAPAQVSQPLATGNGRGWRAWRPARTATPSLQPDFSAQTCVRSQYSVQTRTSRSIPVHRHWFRPKLYAKSILSDPIPPSKLRLGRNTRFKLQLRDRFQHTNFSLGPNCIPTLYSAIRFHRANVRQAAIHNSNSIFATKFSSQTIDFGLGPS